ncbi:Omega-6 fatty acid desaturase, chloroplastic [Sesamum angolense]|uniref:Omega-6 fatty acid desaturase, chloroplastic n=1 Tax=Sesamum angolense TaxID=2727404 RepID=A0AAE1WGG6_9LAMI|nr:Omega-6 fatty acid desaturase, chloroplastic [Sesamum angolense]
MRFRAHHSLQFYLQKCSLPIVELLRRGSIFLKNKSKRGLLNCSFFGQPWLVELRTRASFSWDPRKGRLKATGFSPRVLHQENGCFHRSEKPNFHNYTFMVSMLEAVFAFSHLKGAYLLKWVGQPQRRSKKNQSLISFRKHKVVKAVAVSVAPPPADSAEHRQQLCQEYGFQQIGEPLPDNVTLRDIIDTLPKKFFVIGHDCAHKSFSRNKLVEDIVGTLAFLPLIYPLVSVIHCIAEIQWLVEDTAWQPVNPEEFDSSPVLRKAIIYGYGPFRPWMSIAHWLICHFDLKKFRPNEVNRVKISLACVFAFMAIGWPLIIYKTGIQGWIKFWLMPWLGYHFWMSTFTMVHHTSPHIPFKSSEEWNAAQAQLNGTVHCDYPSWIEVLCHDINVHIPHHISPRIPSYNLRAAHQSLQENWGKYMNEATWNWRLMKTILTVCHVYHKGQNYIAFDELAPEESQPITFLKRVMPDYA